MQIERAHFSVSVVTFLGEGRAAPPGTEVLCRRRNSLEPF